MVPALVKSTIALGTGIAGIFTPKLKLNDVTDSDYNAIQAQICDNIKNISQPKDGTVAVATISYVANIPFSAVDGPVIENTMPTVDVFHNVGKNISIPIPPSNTNLDLFNKLAELKDGLNTDKNNEIVTAFLLPVGKINISNSPYKTLDGEGTDNPKSKGTDKYYTLSLAKIYPVNIQIIGLKTIKSADNPQYYLIGSAQIDVPTNEPTDLYSVPVPKAQFFGKTNFALSLSDSGAITKLEYGKAGGLGELIDSGTALAANFQAQSQTTAQQAAAVQAQSDLIYQTQRLTQCKASPTTCPGK